MHLTKSLIYGRYAAITRMDLLQGLVLGSAMILGSWTGRALIARLPEQSFARLVEVLLIISAIAMIVGAS